MTMPTPLDPATLATAQDLMDQLRIVECPLVRTVERVVAEHENLVQRWPRLYRAPCSRPPRDMRVRIEPEGLLELLNQTHAAWRAVCVTHTTAWQLALLLVASRLEVERIIAHRRRRHPGRAPPPPGYLH